MTKKAFVTGTGLATLTFAIMAGRAAAQSVSKDSLNGAKSPSFADKKQPAMEQHRSLIGSATPLETESTPSKSEAGGPEGAPGPCFQPSPNCQAPDNTSASNATSGKYNCADDFRPTVSGSITTICWWGVYLPGIVADSFTVRYYANAAGLPGTPLGTFVQGAGLSVIGPTATGGLIAGIAPEYEYSATHAPVPVTAGQCYWVEIVNAVPAGTDWYWERAVPGNGRALQDGNPPNGYGGNDSILYDLRFCTSIALGDPTPCLPPPPANDNCVNAIPIVAGVPQTGEIAGATNDYPGTCGGSTTAKDVWYVYASTTCGVVSANTCTGTNYDSVLEVLSDCGGTTIACNDDFCTFQSTVSWVVAPGTSYLIRVAGFNGAVGAYTLSLVEPPPPTGRCCVGQSCSETLQANCSGTWTPCATCETGTLHDYSNAPALPIADFTIVNDAIIVPDSFDIGDVELDLNISHTYVGDLCVSIGHNGTTVELIARIGNSTPANCYLGPPFGCGADNLFVTLDDEAFVAIETAPCVTPFSGPFVPNISLSAFDGMPVNGIWHIFVSDNGGGDVGTFNSWSLRVREQGPSPCQPVCALPGDMDNNGTHNGTDIAGFVPCYIAGNTGGACACANMDGNSSLNASDLAGFVAVLISP